MLFLKALLLSVTILFLSGPVVGGSESEPRFRCWNRHDEVGHCVRAGTQFCPSGTLWPDVSQGCAEDVVKCVVMANYIGTMLHSKSI